MKAIKYLVAGALVLSFSAPTMAQDVKSQVDAITKVIVDAKGDVNATKANVKDFMKANKKNAEALAGLGRAFLYAKNFEQAKVYADMAMKVGKNSAAGYILRGDIASAEDNGGEAAAYYEQGTYYEPQNPTSYVKYARVYQKVNPTDAVAMLEKLRSVKPDYPVDAAAGYMYSSNNQLKSAMTYYDKVTDVTALEDYILFDYTSTAYVLEQYDKAAKLAAAGSQKYPEYSSFYRVGMYANDKLKNYSDAVNYGQKLFNTTDTIKYTVNDYTYYADALMNSGKYDDAIAAYKKISEVDPENKDANKYICTLYRKQKKYADAIAAMEQYIKDAGDNATNIDYKTLADIYTDEASDENATDAQKKAAYENADKVYVRIGEKFENSGAYVAWNRALMNYQINPDVKAGRSLPFYQQYIEIVEPKAEKTRAENNALATAYTYLAVHYIQNDKKAEAKQWAAKLLQIRPDDSNGLQIMQVK